MAPFQELYELPLDKLLENAEKGIPSMQGRTLTNVVSTIVSKYFTETSLHSCQLLLYDCACSGITHSEQMVDSVKQLLFKEDSVFNNEELIKHTASSLWFWPCTSDCTQGLHTFDVVTAESLLNTPVVNLSLFIMFLEDPVIRLDESTDADIFEYIQLIKSLAAGNGNVVVCLIAWKQPSENNCDYTFHMMEM